jgi:hypothetical protein
MLPSSSAYFSAAGQDTRSVFGRMGARMPCTTSSMMVDGAYTQEEGGEDEEVEVAEEGGEY